MDEQLPLLLTACFTIMLSSCRAGDACPYLHEVSGSVRKDGSSGGSTASSAKDEVNRAPKSASHEEEGVIANRASVDSSMVALPERPRVPRSTAVQKPVSKAERENPREFQINQLRRRFHPKEQNDSSGTFLAFGMAPSDPDFPFDMAELQCILHVPLTYPSSGRPTLRVTNPEMDKGFQINVEKGFDDFVDASLKNNGRGTLLGWMNALDRELERLLTTERAPTIKIVPNVGNKEKPKPTQVTGDIAQRPSRPVDSTSRVEERPIVSQPSVNRSRTYTAEERAEAEKKRNDETRQLEARLRRLPFFRKSPDGVSFTIPAQPSKPNLLPLPLRSIKTLKLIVPELYPLEQSRIEVQGIDGIEAQSLETGFEKWVQESPQLNLTSRVNYLVHNMHVLVNKAVEELSKPAPEPEPVSSATNTVPAPSQPSTTEPVPIKELEDRSHVKIIPRPPEWSVPDPGSGSDSDSNISTDYDSEDASTTDEEEGGAPVPETSATSTSRGVALSFPFLELYGIELLELKNLNITVKCERCKDIMDVKNVRAANDPSSASPARVESCKKCSNYMTIGFRRELMHGSSNRAGYLDLEGCTVADLLPRALQLTAAISTVFKIPEVKFLVVGTAAVTRHALPRKKRKEVLGITAGQELPRRGRCEHYAKSYRWFRFSCCAKVFPCDKCHDAAEDHPNEHANRMICGFCSREQIYRPEDCGICRSVLVGKAGSGFWEGDPRKYKRRGGTSTNPAKKK
ncbi:CHY zinc finger domain protein [Paecilomyces variotii No. 5]|uniref:CHY zinc finger domain protein n=1 Tax=Byssochlamys spectabilis (strain No. 5 / NBRC 109023) TaxID=1356009 RepID=V5G6E2_BYSSN|nr:CHY zinc finger domain protein [Paecilomyces variotii No. 5]